MVYSGITTQKILFFCSIICTLMLHMKLQVGSINFSSHYNDYTNPLRVDVNDSRIFGVTTPQDILTNERWLDIELPLVSVTMYIHQLWTCMYLSVCM